MNKQQNQDQQQNPQQNQDQNQQQVQQQDRQKRLASFCGCATRDQRIDQNSSSVNSGSECERRVSSWVLVEKAVCIWTDSPCVLSLIHGWSEKPLAMFWIWSRSWQRNQAFKRLLQTWLIVFGWFWAEGEDANAMGRLHNNISDNNRSAQLKEQGIIGNTRLKVITYLLEEAGKPEAHGRWRTVTRLGSDEARWKICSCIRI